MAPRPPAQAPRRVPNQHKRPIIDVIVSSLCSERSWYKISLANSYVKMHFYRLPYTFVKKNPAAYWL